jgi:predicted RNA-binding protein YlxR (DUF448 family)
MLKKKKIPLRMCLGCQEMKPKKELIRVVRCANSDNIMVDITGKQSGRGAYLCKKLECLEKAYKTKRVEKALEHSVSPEVYDQLRKEIIPGE